MVIDLSNPMIVYAREKVDFPYMRLFATVFEEYILEYKNARLEALTDPDQAICLSRLAKKLYVNGVPSTEFFAEERAQLAPDLTDAQRANEFMLIISRDLFANFDPNVKENGEMVKPRNIYYVLKENGEKDFVTTPEPTKMQKMFPSKNKEIIDYYALYENLIKQLDTGSLAKVFQGRYKNKF